jgi:putative membrane protein insertion efficiency factor
MSFAARALIGLVRLYQWTLRPLIGAQCRFHPSCSEYAVAALAQHGALRGSLLAAWRVLRCNPWNAGGFDPVPAKLSSRNRTAP